MIWPPFPHLLPDDVYAYALSKALTQVSAPATVGLYSACQNRINRILKKIEGTFQHVRHLTWGWVGKRCVPAPCCRSARSKGFSVNSPLMSKPQWADRLKCTFIAVDARRFHWLLHWFICCSQTMKMSYRESWHAGDPCITPKLPLIWLIENWTQCSAGLWRNVVFNTQMIILLNAGLNTGLTHFCGLDFFFFF